MCASLLMRFLPTLVALKSLAAAAPPQLKLLNVSFENALHPFLPPNSSSAYDSTVCMNPMIVKVDEEWRLYYAGADNSSKHRIALATAPVTGPTPLNAQWTRRGVVIDHGEPGSFNSEWSEFFRMTEFSTKI